MLVKKEKENCNGSTGDPPIDILLYVNHFARYCIEQEGIDPVIVKLEELNAQTHNLTSPCIRSLILCKLEKQLFSRNFRSDVSHSLSNLKKYL